MTCPIDHEGRKRAQIIGLGLIGGSLGLGLRALGWHVSGFDSDPTITERALVRGVIDAAGYDSDARFAVVATPLADVADLALDALSRLSEDAVVTDVAGVKGPVVAAVRHERFVGGHPMAGSEQSGLDGADGTLFDGATWVLTPGAWTDPQAFGLVAEVVRGLGAEIVSLPPERHDALVAVVSHVPHLVAATLMSDAARRSQEHAALLRLAAGGFRDMTRVAAGDPGIWPDVCAQNATAIVDALDSLLGALGRARAAVASGDRDALWGLLTEAMVARRSLPGRVGRPEELVELRVTVADRPGVLAEVTSVAAELDVSVFDIEIAHSAEGGGGVVILVVGAEEEVGLREALRERGMRVGTKRLS